MTRQFTGIDSDRLNENEKEKKVRKEPEPDCLKCHDTGKIIVDHDRYGLIIQSCPNCSEGEQRRLNNAMFRRMFH